jgi:hypothetical protein
MVTTQRIVHVPSLLDIVAAFERRRGWQELEFWRNICFVCLHLGNVGADVTALSALIIYLFHKFCISRTSGKQSVAFPLTESCCKLLLLQA